MERSKEGSVCLAFFLFVIFLPVVVTARTPLVCELCKAAPYPWAGWEGVITFPRISPLFPAFHPTLTTQVDQTSVNYRINHRQVGRTGGKSKINE
ncbi:hypothetical protein E2C01_031656 [Portunus trituberculatus]|uniref:Secreted protein n=1 Tax=Portunus trituberculatus TaxID=210409 RepID=A0A5B7EU20_PORTR|nr:hypothetical protein [Portunus trituberculatus]